MYKYIYDVYKNKIYISNNTPLGHSHPATQGISKVKE